MCFCVLCVCVCFLSLRWEFVCLVTTELEWGESSSKFFAAGIVRVTNACYLATYPLINITNKCFYLEVSLDA